MNRPTYRRRTPFAPAPERLEYRRLLTSAAFAKGFGAGPNNSASVEAEAVDPGGNVYVTGNFGGKVAFGPVSLTSRGERNVFVAKLNPAGNVLWAKSMGSAATGDYGRGLALDPRNGDPVVTGFFSGAAQFGASSLGNNGQGDIFVERLNPANGNVLWARGFGGPGSDQGQSVAVDRSGNAYITGSFQNSVAFGATTLTTPDTDSTDIFVTKLDAAGSVVWATQLGGSGQDSGFGVAADAAGNAYVTGNFTGTGQFGGVTLTSAGDSDAFVAKLSAAGDVAWAVAEGGIGHDDGVAIAVTPDGRGVYATGDFVGTVPFGAASLTSAGQDDTFVQKLDGSGASVWARRYGGTGFDAGFGITLDAAGSVYTTGVFQGTAGFGPTTLTSAGDYDVYLAKLNPGGSLVLARDFGGGAGEQAYQVAVGGPKSSITLVGAYGAAFNVFNDGLPSAGSGYVIQISQAARAAGSEALSDFDSVGYSQIAVYRPATRQWLALAQTGGHLLGTFGRRGDIPVAGDYDRLGHTELAVYRPSTRQWFAVGPRGSHLLGTFGQRGDIPVPGDYDRTGHTELAVFRPSTRQWFAVGPRGAHLLGTFGRAGDIPVPGDYDGTGHTELAVFRPSTRQWFAVGPRGSHLLGTFGARGDVPAPGDFDGLGHAELAVFRPSTAQWIVRGANGDRLMNVFGLGSDIPTES